MRAPRCPYGLAERGRAWWRWAWRTPQSERWSAGALYTVARRAQLEDQLAAVEFDDQLDLADLLAGADPEAISRVEWALGTLKSAAAGSLAFSREMRALEAQLGLDAKSMTPKVDDGSGLEVSKLDELRARRDRNAGGAAP